MASVLSMKGTDGKTLFPPELTNEMFNLVKGKSSLARLSASRPISFSGETMWTFTLDKEVDVVDENGAKTNGGATLAQISTKPVKIEYGYRMSQEFLFAAQDIQLQHLQAFSEGFAAKVARGIDIMAFHGFNPRSGSASTVIGDNNFDSKVTQTVTVTSSANADVESAIALVQDAEFDVTGMAIAPAFRSSLAALAYKDGRPMFPQLGWGASPGEIHGMPVDVNSTVSYGGSLDRAIIGNFRDYFRWGYARNIPIEIIEYGNPDNDATAGDLKGHNQIYIRGEAYIGWGILLPKAFAIVKAAASSSSDTEDNS